MSRQTTWTCDHCDASMAIDHECAALPVGWIEIELGVDDDPDDEDGPTTEAYEFCSWRCAAAFCTEQARRPDGPTRDRRTVQ